MSALDDAIRAAFAEEGEVVTRWLVICEKFDGSGERVLERTDGSADGERLTAWDRKGLMFESLFGSVWR